MGMSSDLIAGWSHLVLDIRALLSNKASLLNLDCSSDAFLARYGCPDDC